MVQSFGARAARGLRDALARGPHRPGGVAPAPARARREAPGRAHLRAARATTTAWASSSSSRRATPSRSTTSAYGRVPASAPHAGRGRLGRAVLVDHARARGRPRRRPAAAHRRRSSRRVNVDPDALVIVEGACPASVARARRARPRAAGGVVLRRRRRARRSTTRRSRRGRRATRACASSPSTACTSRGRSRSTRTARAPRLVRSSSTTLVADASVPGRTVTVVGFDPGDSDWPLKASFVLFVRNVVELARLHRAQGAAGPGAYRGSGSRRRAGGDDEGARRRARASPSARSPAKDGVAILPPLDRAGLYHVRWNEPHVGAALIAANLTSAQRERRAARGRSPSQARRGAAATTAPRTCSTHTASGSPGSRLLAALAIASDVYWTTRAAAASRRAGSASDDRPPSRASGCSGPAWRSSPVVLALALAARRRAVLGAGGARRGARRGRAARLRGARRRRARPRDVRALRPSAGAAARRRGRPLPRRRALSRLPLADGRVRRRARHRRRCRRSPALAAALIVAEPELGRPARSPGGRRGGRPLAVHRPRPRRRGARARGAPGRREVDARRRPHRHRRLRRRGRGRGSAAATAARRRRPSAWRWGATRRTWRRRSAARSPSSRPTPSGGIVLVSDGVQTRGDALAAAAAAVAADVPVDVVVLEQKVRPGRPRRERARAAARRRGRALRASRRDVERGRHRRGAPRAARRRRGARRAHAHREGRGRPPAARDGERPGAAPLRRGGDGARSRRPTRRPTTTSGARSCACAAPRWRSSSRETSGTAPRCARRSRRAASAPSSASTTGVPADVGGLAPYDLVVLSDVRASDLEHDADRRPRRLRARPRRGPPAHGGRPLDGARRLRAHADRGGVPGRVRPEAGEAPRVPRRGDRHRLQRLDGGDGRRAHQARARERGRGALGLAPRPRRSPRASSTSTRWCAGRSPCPR